MKRFITMTAIAAVEVLFGCASQTAGVAQTSGLGLPSTGTVAGQMLTSGVQTGSAAAGQVPALDTAAGALGSAAATAPVAGQGASLTDILVQKLGVSTEQATGGAGAIFSTAQKSMSASDFAQVSKAVPGMDQYLAAAPSQSATPASGTAGLLGAAGSALGGSNLGTMASLAGSFQSMGLNSGMVGQFVPVVMQYVQAQGGSYTMGLLQSALAH